MTDPFRPADILPRRGPPPSRGEKGARGAGQGRGRRTFTATLGSGQLALHLRAVERTVPVVLSGPLRSAKARCGG